MTDAKKTMLKCFFNIVRDIGDDETPSRRVTEMTLLANHFFVHTFPTNDEKKYTVALTMFKAGSWRGSMKNSDGQTLIVRRYGSKNTAQTAHEAMINLVIALAKNMSPRLEIAACAAFGAVTAIGCVTYFDAPALLRFFGCVAAMIAGSLSVLYATFAFEFLSVVTKELKRDSEKE